MKRNLDQYNLLVPGTDLVVEKGDILSISSDMRGIHPMFGPDEVSNFDIKVNSKTYRVERASVKVFENFIELYKGLDKRPPELTASEKLLTEILAELKLLNTKLK